MASLRLPTWERIVLGKLRAVQRGSWVSALRGHLADTSVVVDGDVLGNLATKQTPCGSHAHRGPRARGVHALRHRAWRRRGRERRAHGGDQGFIRAAGKQEIAAYAATGEGSDKAGAYAAQGIGAYFIERIEAPRATSSVACV